MNYLEYLKFDEREKIKSVKNQVIVGCRLEAFG